jgi:hypothetical protein
LQNVGGFGEQRRVSVLRGAGRTFTIGHGRIAPEFLAVFDVVRTVAQGAYSGVGPAIRGSGSGLVVLDLSFKCRHLRFEIFFTPHLGLDQGLQLFDLAGELDQQTEVQLSRSTGEANATEYSRRQPPWLCQLAKCGVLLPIR